MDRSPDSLHCEDDGQRRWCRACTYETHECPSVRHFQWMYAVAGTIQDPAWDKPLYNHTRWRPPDMVALATLLSSLALFLSLLTTKWTQLKTIMLIKDYHFSCPERITF